MKSPTINPVKVDRRLPIHELNARRARKRILSHPERSAGEPKQPAAPSTAAPPPS